MSLSFKRGLFRPCMLRGMARTAHTPRRVRPGRFAWRGWLRGACACLVAFATGATPVQAGRGQDGEQARAREHLRRNEYVPLAQLLADALRRHPGHAIEVELEDGDEYEIEILRHDGVVVELHYDARTGRLLKTEIEDD